MSEVEKLDLSLSAMGVPDFPKEIMFPDELNRYLREQIQYLSHENGMLKKNLNDVELVQTSNEKTIEQLNKKLQKYETPMESSSFISVGSIASSKLVELSKKLREKNSEIAASKTKLSKLEQVIFEMKQEQNNGNKDIINEIRPKCELEQELKLVKETLSATNKKFFEIKNANTQLNNDMKLANKLLQQELGDSFENMQSLLNVNPNWRGRAQVICDLQQKCNDMKEKVKALQDKSGTNILKSERELRINNDKRWEQLSQQNSQMKVELFELQRKLDAAKARCRVFDSECSTLRSRFSAAHEQTNRDTNLITTLTAQISQMQKYQSDTTRATEAMQQKLQKDYATVQTSFEKERCKSEHLEITVRDLEKEIARLQRCQSSSGTKKTLDGTDHNSTTTNAVQILETERMRLLELTALSNRRLDEERDAHAATHAQYALERQRTARLDAKVARLQLQVAGDLGVQQQQQTVAQSGRAGGTGVGGSQYGNGKVVVDVGVKRGGGAVVGQGSPAGLELQSVRDKLELAEEKIKAFKTRLQIEQNERKSDLQEFSKILHSKPNKMMD